MGRDFLKEFGPERRIRPLDSSGGKIPERSVMDYQPPAGPIGIMDNAVGLNGKNVGNCGTQESRSVFGDGAGGMSTQGHPRRVQGRYD